MKIRIDYDQVLRQAREIESVAVDLEEARKELRGIVSDIDANWDGEASNVYMQRCNRLEEYIREVSRDMNRVSATIREVVRIIREADERAKALASKLSSGK